MKARLEYEGWETWQNPNKIAPLEVDLEHINYVNLFKWIIHYIDEGIYYDYVDREGYEEGQPICGFASFVESVTSDFLYELEYYRKNFEVYQKMENRYDSEIGYVRIILEE